VIDLPDSFDLKKRGCYAFIDVDCFFDSTGVIFKIIPFSLYVLNRKNEILREYNYYSKESENISEAEALRYANWAILSLPRFTSIKRKPKNIKCNETITNENSCPLEYKLQ
ncbi:MAG TPA: hypothetical protein VHD35_01065, partial [Chitinophagaceae bacterium]|nr:hypothetical protein [Chitinophagaceae bacterium]